MILLPEKVNFKLQSIKHVKEAFFLTPEARVHNENITVIKIYAANNTRITLIKQKLYGGRTKMKA